ncbi:MAG: RidA family protein [Deltaproteobacteria bacterium]|nr:RidA family protein [Deltaproteobacteria bacterium]
MEKIKIEPVFCPQAPKPLGNYSHAVVAGQLIYLSGIASRDFETNQVPGLVLDDMGCKVSYDIKQETKGTLENIRKILTAAGSDLEHVIEVNTYLLDMRDFKAYNEVFAQFFPAHRPARTTIAVVGLPGNISIEIKVIAVKK